MFKWYTSKTGWNGTVYPWSQIHFWWRQTFPIWKDWEYTVRMFLFFFPFCSHGLVGFQFFSILIHAVILASQIFG